MLRSREPMGTVLKSQGLTPRQDTSIVANQNLSDSILGSYNSNAVPRANWL
jgi:hypothetical protein